ncbi:MAG TPA: hypothetical protein EYO61_01625 [Campylobacterales bacterium]|nr:hypothetical protein [Campylobacterales bacterium]
MASSITQTIGLGSDNRLSMDMIEKLRAVDEKAIIDPIDNNITETEDKKKALSEITSLMNDLESSVSSLGGDTLYLERTAYVSSEGINISIDKGVNPQSLSIDVNQLAKEEVRQSNTFASRTDTIADNDGNVTISLNGISETFSVTSSTTLEEFAQMINDSSLDATAKILNTGNNEYRLVLTSNVTGESNGFTITEDDGINLGLSDDNNIVQQAQDAIFQYNGVEVRRDSNKIDDLVYGVNLELTQVTDQPINIDIKEDSNSIASTLQNFVDNYNKLMEKLNEVTDYNEETKEAGIFQGDNNINGIKRDINRLLLQVDSQGRSMMDYGLSLDKEGTLSFDANEFNKKFSDNPSDVQSFFVGQDITDRGITTHEDGFFYKLEESLDRYVDFGSGILQTLTTDLENQEKRLNEEKEKAMALLDSRYDRMAQQFAQQDAIIGQINQQMKALQMQIDIQTAKK